jgi:hypothetical protein
MHKLQGGTTGSSGGGDGRQQQQAAASTHGHTMFESIGFGAALNRGL